MAVVIESVPDMQRYADAARLQGKRIGVVPTMGALHEGHLSLIRLAASSSDLVVCTIFVNPTQFGPSEDFESYPREMEADMKKASSAGASVMFTPSVKEMYAQDHQTYVVNDSIAGVFEGKERPGHFRGVATVVLKLFHAVKPHSAVFGQKDAQQLAVVRTMVRDLGADVEIVAGPIVREPDGLAMSSRNVYLKGDQRKAAAILNTSLSHAEWLVAQGTTSLEALKRAVTEMLSTVPHSGIDYAECVHPDTFAQLEDFRAEGTLMVLAVRFGPTRLLDNRLLRTQTD